MADPSVVTQVAETDDLLLAYEARGPKDGPPVLLLHGWPDDVRAWDAVAAPLAAAGFRTLAPYLRGFGPTRFREASTPRTAQPTVLASDVVQFMEALGLEKATVVGHDWGGRIGYTLAALCPQKVERLIALSVPYQTGVPDGATLDCEQQRAYWYQWFFGSERAREALDGDRRKVCRYLWQTWAPSWKFTEEAFETTAASWDNPDWVDVTLHSYRVRWGNVPGDERFAALDQRLEAHPPITVPTAVLHGEEDGATLLAATENQASSFSSDYRREVLRNVGHFIPRERPEAVLSALVDDR